MSKTILHKYKWKKSRNHDLNIGQIRIQAKKAVNNINKDTL